MPTPAESPNLPSPPNDFSTTATSDLLSGPVGPADGNSTGLLVGAGVLAAILASVAIPAFGTYFQAPPELAVGIGSSPPPEKLAELNAAQRVVDRNNSMLRVALFGAIVGSVLGAAAGVARRQIRLIGMGAVAGLALGVFFGVVGGLATDTLAQRLKSVIEDEMQRIMVIHVAGWAIVGIGVGMTVGLAFQRRVIIARCVLASVAAGLIGGLMFAPLAAVVLPNADTDLPYPEGFPARALWIILPSILMGIATARATKNHRASSQSRATPA